MSRSRLACATLPALLGLLPLGALAQSDPSTAPIADAPPNPDDPCTEADDTIGSRQGETDTSVTGPVTVQGVVVGDYEGPSPALRGFYVQDEGDGNPLTSDGIFVFNGNADSVSLGDLVQVIAPLLR